jgi:hypothetical protein
VILQDSEILTGVGVVWMGQGVAAFTGFTNEVLTGSQSPEQWLFDPDATKTQQRQNYFEAEYAFWASDDGTADGSSFTGRRARNKWVLSPVLPLSCFRRRLTGRLTTG